MKLYAKCDPEYFDLLDMKSIEFRQFESIVIENSETGEKREFLVEDVRRLLPSEAENVKKLYTKVPWEPSLRMFAIDLGDELDRNDALVSVPLRFRRWPDIGQNV